MFHFLSHDVDQAASALTARPVDRIHLGSFDGAGLIRRRIGALALAAAVLFVASLVAGVL